MYRQYMLYRFKLANYGSFNYNVQPQRGIKE